MAGLPQAPLWGLGKVIALEHRELRCACVDLDPADADLELLLEELWNGGGEPELAFRARERVVARLAPAAEGGVAGAEELSLPASGDYALAVAERGTLDGLTVRTAAPPTPGPGELAIRVRATGLNFRDVLNALGLYPGDAGPLGCECTGEVAVVGAGVAGFAPGERVMAIAPGSFASTVIAPAAAVARLPDGMSFEQAATIPAAFLTAYHCLHQIAQLRAGDRVLIHAAAGGVGQAAVQLARLAGAEVFGTASPPKAGVLRALGVHHVLNSRTLDFADRVSELTGGRGVDVVLNALAGPFIAKSLSCLTSGGRFVEIGKADILDPAAAAQLRPDVAYTAVDLFELLAREPDRVAAMFAALTGLFADGRLTPLPTTIFPLRRTVSALRTMQQARHTGKIVITHPQPVAFRPDAVYLVTGGLGGLGLAAAGWMVERGARHVVLVGRSEPGPAAQARIAALGQAGAEMTVARADVGSHAEMAELLARIEGSGRRLRGVIHAAGVLDDGVLRQQTAERFAGVLHAKVAGAWNLHLLTRHRGLDVFVLYSSIASLLGSTGQANYAAANAFLDALAAHRRALGLPALGINWGAWADIGIAAERGIGERLRLKGLGAIAPDQGLTVLERLMADPPTRVGVSPIDWPRLRETWPDLPFFAEFRAAAQPSAAAVAAGGPSARAGAAPADPAARHAWLIETITSQVAKVLGLKGGTIDRQQGFFELGLDSLASVELRTLLQTALGRALPATVAFDYPTVDALVAFIEGLDAPAAPPSPPEKRRDGMLAEVDRLTDSEAEESLLKVLEELHY